MKKLVRSRTNRKLAGVCGGIADYFGVDPMLIRIITVVLFFVTWFFPIPIAYLVLTFVLPNEGDTVE
ncbi:PspC domain-containing protein [Salibacterium qingdaonense]|uniref:Phage shock protein C (PspC) family protein n=1 Tax=Salibacterium qingdaonense TaxID=266892 RepID=A0A1I4KXD3_9BACI|nr:PspC domain-containing protein [Salibacterium qingdaonense]SFL83464.1 phage shock protein C (PspC) family protein [Salibacterium qingdaonense]